MKDERKKEKKKKLIKGEKNGLCNVTACQSPTDVVFFNKGTSKYYCASCAQRINDANKEYPDTERLFDDKYLCRTDEGLLPRESYNFV